jgi:hypothetical protein
LLWKEINSAWHFSPAASIPRNAASVPLTAAAVAAFSPGPQVRRSVCAHLDSTVTATLYKTCRRFALAPMPGRKMI